MSGRELMNAASGPDQRELSGRRWRYCAVRPVMLAAVMLLSVASVDARL
jgi:hypothetical protein